jgi:competence ComEA-like helix-hairpin-helix protein
MGERRAAIVLLLLAAAGLVVRFARPGGEPPGSISYRWTEDRQSRDSVAAMAARLARPLKPGEKIDLDRASAEELTRLPRIGPALAARILADRAARGPFGSLEALGRVSGIGPVTLEALRPHVSFSGRPEPQWVLGDPPVDGPPGKVRLNTATERELLQLPGIGPARARAIVADREANGPYRTLEDLSRVPGIGPGILQRLRGRVIVP